MVKPVERQLIEAATHQSGNSLKQQLIEVATHRSGNSSKRQLTECPLEVTFTK
jgi:hypothetical protein